MSNKNQANIPLQKSTRKTFDKKIMSKLIEKYGNLTYNQAFLILINYSNEISKILPKELPENLKIN